MASAYCEVSDIQMEFKNLDLGLADSVVQSTTVDEWIEQASAEINNRLSAHYKVPFQTSAPATIGADGLSFIKMLCVNLVSQRVKDVLESKNVRVETNSDIKVDTASKARAILKQIAAKEIPLIGGVAITSNDGVTSFVSHNSDAARRTFTRDGVDW